MPKKYPKSSNYFNVRRKIGAKRRNYHWEKWTSLEAGEALEIAPLLEQNHSNSVSNVIKLIEEHCSKNNITSKSLKISLQDLEEKAFPPSAFIKIIQKLIDNDYSISFNFSEAFLLDFDESPPSHYRQTDDYNLQDKVAYRDIISSLPYQLSKALFNQFKPKLYLGSSETDELVATHYSSIKQADQSEAFSDLENSLTTLPYFNSVYEAIIHYEIEKYRNVNTDNDWLILTFKTIQNFEALHLITCLQYYAENNYSELIIILQGECYKVPEIRDQIYQTVINSIHQTNCSIFLHILLFTKDLKSLNPEDNLLSLAPSNQQNDDPFSPLANDTGFYLSSPTIFATIGQYIQEKDDKLFTSQWIEQAKSSSNKPQFKRAEEAISGYIYGQESIDKIRQSKRYNKQELKSQIGLTFNFNLELQQNMQQEVEQSQSLKQKQDLSKQQCLVQQRKNSLYHQVNAPFYIPPLPISFVLESIRSQAKTDLEKMGKERQQLETIYYTSWYRSNYSRQAILTKLSAYPTTEFFIDLFAKMVGQAYTISPEMEKVLDEETCSNVSISELIKISGYMAKKTFSSPLYLAFGKYTLIPLANDSNESIEGYLLSPIMRKLADFSDGINPASRLSGHSYLWGNSALQGWDSVSTAQSDRPRLPLRVSSLALMANNENRGYQSHWDRFFNNNDNPYLYTLLELFKPNCNDQPDYIKQKEAEFLALIQLDFPDYFNLVKQFFENFEIHNLDNIRIFVQLLLSVGREKFTLFLDYLQYIDERGLLKHFYKIYFKYAPTVFSLVNFFQDKEEELVSHSHYEKKRPGKTNHQLEANEACFLTLAKRTPLANSGEDWPLFEKFAHGVLIFAAKNYMRLQANSLDEIESFWCRAAAKFLAYSGGNPKQQRALLHHFLATLLTEEGLNLANLRKLDTLLVCLENLLDHAIEKNTLKEQISELEDLSLAWTDVPYAITYNGFHLISKEMEIKAGSIGYGKNSYTVSLKELNQVIREFNPHSPPLKTAVFRYLGKESLREDLDFYRKLYPVQDVNPETNGLNQLIWAYYVSSFSGIHYNARPDEVLFITDCLQFVQDHPYTKTIDADLMILFISRFVSRLYQVQTSEQKGNLTLWSLWQKNHLRFNIPSHRTVPEILSHKFDQKQLKRFLLNHQKNLRQALPTLLEHLVLKDERMNDKEQAGRILVEPLIACFFGKNDKKGYPICLQLLNQLTPHLSIHFFLDHLLEVLLLIENLQQLKQADLSLLAEILAIIRKQPDINFAIALLRLCREKLQQQPENLKFCTLFLHYLATKPQFLPLVDGLDAELELIWDYFLEASLEETALPILFALYQTLKGDTETLKMSLDLLHDDKIYAFFHRHLNDRLSRSLLQNAIKLIKTTQEPRCVLSVIEQIGYDNDLYFEKLLEFEVEQLAPILFLLNTIGNQHQVSLFNLLDFLGQIPVECLHTVASLCKSHPIPIPQLLEVLKSPSLVDEIDLLEEQLYEQDLANYVYDPSDIAQKIDQIHYNSWDERPAKQLSSHEQNALARDHSKLMDFIQNHPVYIEHKNGVTRSYTVHQLKMRHFPLLFKALQTRIRQGENKKENQLALLALLSVALKRTCKKFPRSTQLLPLIHSLSEEEPLVQELKTGAGKSIIAALHAALRIAEDRTVLIPTENEKLGQDGISVFQDFYAYLGIPSGAQIIEAHSPYSDFIPNGINYSTPYGLALFFISMALQKKPIPKNCDLIWDEIDASLTSTVPFRLAATLDPLLLDTKNWSKIYGYLLDFVQEKALFLENHCSSKADIHNFRQFCLSINQEKQVNTFLNQISDALLGTFIDSARLAVQLEDKVDYMVVEKKDNKKSLYSAPILPHTSRAEPRASFGSGAQPLLHTDKNRGLPADAALIFSASPDTETIVSMTPKNLADMVRRKGGRIIGATATPGMPNQLQEFRQLYGISAIHYPHFHPDRCQDFGLYPAEGWDDQKNTVLALIQESRISRPGQPILIICESAQAASDLNDDLSISWEPQSYYGYSANPHHEEQFIAMAGNDNKISITTKCESRGADFDTEHEQGFLVINLCTHLTEEEKVQIKGRSARNGKPGQFCSVVDVLQFGLQKTDSAEQIAVAFETFQKAIGLKAQKEREITRFLEDSRYLVTCYLLDLRKKADKILSRQHGLEHSLIPTLEFMKILRDFNKKAEENYSELLKQDALSKHEMKQHFLEYLSHEYNQILEHCLPEEKYARYQPIEPLIPLEKLETFQGINQVQIKQLLILSELLSKGWEAVGHQSVHLVLPHIEQIADALDEYGKNQRGLKTIVGKMLSHYQLINMPELIEQIECIELQCIELLNELPEGAETVINKENAQIFISQYFSTLKTHCREERWEELALPVVPDSIFWGATHSNSSFAASMVSNLGQWGVKKGAKIGSYLFVKLYVMPKIMDSLKTQIESLEDETTQLNLMKTLRDLEGPLTDFLQAIPFDLQSEEGIWSLFLDKLLPILEHPSTQTAAQLFGQETASLLGAVITFIKALQPYRAFSFKKLVGLETLLPLFQLACQLDLIQQLLKKPLFTTILDRFSILDKTFFSSFYHFDFRTLVDFFHLLAHPVFFKFLKTLPQEATFSHLNAWLSPKATSIPEPISQSLKELQEYQQNRERLEETSRLRLQGLKEKFGLSPEILHQDLEALVPVFPETPSIPEPFLSRLLTLASAHPIKSLLLFALSCWIILPILIISAVIYSCLVLYEKIIALTATSNTVEEIYFEPINRYLTPPEPSAFVVEEVVDVEINLRSQENSNNDIALANTNQNDKELMRHCYPPHSSFSLGIFVNGKNLNQCANESDNVLETNTPLFL